MKINTIVFTLSALAINFEVAYANSDHKSDHRAGHKAHEHGAASLDFVAQGKTLNLNFRSPADSIYGFEHEPKSELEKENQKKGIALLKEKFTEIVVLDAKLECLLKQSTVEVKKESAKHSAIVANYEFECVKALSGTSVQVDFSKYFKSVKSISVQILSGEKQNSTKLKQKGWVEL